MNDFLLGGLASGIGSLVGGVATAAAQRSANKTNLQIAREQNDLNYRMFNEQNKFNLDMWNRENEYNTPAAQRARFEAAGINPYMALGNMQAGNASSVHSAQAQPAVGATMQPVTGLGEGIQNAIVNSINGFSAQAQIEKTKAEARNVSIDNITKLSRDYMALKKAGLDAEAQQIFNTFQSETLQVRKNILDQSLAESMKHVELMNEQIRSAQIANDIQQQFGSRLAEAQLNQLIAECEKVSAEVMRMKQLLPFEKALMASEKVANYAAANLNQQKAATEQALRPIFAELYSNEAEGAFWNARQQKFDYGQWQGHKDNWLDLRTNFKQRDQYLEEQRQQLEYEKALLNLFGLGLVGKGASYFTKGRRIEVKGFNVEQSKTPTVIGFNVK